LGLKGVKPEKPNNQGKTAKTGEKKYKKEDVWSPKGRKKESWGKLPRIGGPIAYYRGMSGIGSGKKLAT